MSVCNVRAKYIQPRYKNLREWMSDSDNVYIGRRGIVFVDGRRYPPTSSLWANPYKDEDGISKFETYIRERIERENLWEDLEALRGKNLGCWCHPKRCHGDVLVKLLAERKFSAQKGRLDALSDGE